jgi:hypothetical protein
MKDPWWRETYDISEVNYVRFMNLLGGIVHTMRLQCGTVVF